MTIYRHTLYLCSLYVDVYFFHLSLDVLFLFLIYTHGSYYLYVIYYFCFTQKCLDDDDGNDDDASDDDDGDASSTDEMST